MWRTARLALLDRPAKVADLVAPASNRAPGLNWALDDQVAFEGVSGRSRGSEGTI
jgi:hypothetical protein